MDLPEDVAAQVPQEYRDHPFVKDAPDLPTFLKNAVETKKMVGDSIRLPGKDAKPEDAEKWWTETQPKLAERGFIEVAPSKAEDYKLPKIEGFNPDPQLVESFIKDVALPTKLTPKQLEAVVSFQHKMTQEMAKNLVTPEAADAEFKQMLGNDYVTVMESVQAASAAMAEDFPQFAEWSKGAYIVSVGPDGKPGKAYPFSAHPMVRGMMEVMGQMTKEDNAGGGTPPNGGETKDAIRGKIDQMMQDPKYKAGNQEFVDQVDELRKRLWGTAEV
jgi:hypothetical protein